MDMKLTDPIMMALQRSLDLSVKRHALLSGNTANLETPGYVARDLDFGAELKRKLENGSEALKATNSRHMQPSRSSASHIVLDYSTPVGADGNNVDLDVNMGKISLNSGQYEDAANLLSMKMRILRNAVRGTGGM